MVVFVAVAVAPAARATTGDAAFRLGDQIAMVVLGAAHRDRAVAAASPGRGSTADRTGIRIRNVLGEKLAALGGRRAAVRLDDGAPWASLDLHDDDTVALLAVQANDGERAVDAVLGAAARCWPRAGRVRGPDVPVTVRLLPAQPGRSADSSASTLRSRAADRAEPQDVPVRRAVPSLAAAVVASPCWRDPPPPR